MFPISARKRTGVEALVTHLAGLMPEGPSCSTRARVSDQSREVRLAELVREAVIRRTFQEVPHAVEVVIEDIDESREDLVRVRALIWVETDSQKGILIGAGGRMIKAIGTAARRELERELGRHVHLDALRARAPSLARRRRPARPPRHRVTAARRAGNGAAPPRP